jgi:hypothetical protein
MMNHAFDYNGHVVSQSRPQKVLRTVKKTIHLDSADRDAIKFHTNGDFVVYLPRVYSNVVSLRLKGAEFPSLTNAYQHSYKYGANIGSGGFDIFKNETTALSASSQVPQYFLVEIEGLNKTDECAVGANRSALIDSFFAKIPAVSSSGAVSSSAPIMISYSDKAYQESIATYSPPVETLDRMRIRCRLHSQQGNLGFIYWSLAAPTANALPTNGLEFNMTFEIEYLENGFDEFSSFETRLGNRQ